VKQNPKKDNTQTHLIQAGGRKPWVVFMGIFGNFLPFVACFLPIKKYTANTKS
jgi:hypothetical protein